MGCSARSRTLGISRAWGSPPRALRSVGSGRDRPARGESVPAMLVSISRALEKRDGQLGHGARVSALAEPVALRLGWGRERLRTLRTAAPLHDIGKVKVRPQVLSKPGPLTQEEREEIQRHPRAGAQLVLPLRRFH